MVRLGLHFINLGKRQKLISRQGFYIYNGLEDVKGYISPANNAGIWHGASVKTAYVPTWSGKKSKRFWKPNVFKMSYYSDLLEERIETTYSEQAIRAIDQAGGIDNYILRTSDKTLCSKFAIALKRKMETVERMLEYGDKSLVEIKKEIAPRNYNKHVWIPREYNNRFYYDWRGPRRHMIYC